MKKLLSVIVCLFLGVTMMMAQTKTVQGVVLSGEDGEPIIGASVVVTGTTTGTVTDIDGNFSLKVADNAKTLTVSFVGMESATVNISNRKMEIVLGASDEVLDEVMVVAYGTQKKSSFTGSASTVDSKKLELRPITSVTNGLEGQTTGVIMTSASGQPGSTASIRVRGFGSINASSTPLYVVDGAPYDGSLSDINPSDIESMTILKDASAGALYGARGANGVVMITTKRGKEGKTNVTWRSTLGWSTRANDGYDMCDQKEFVQLSYEALRNSYVVNNGLTMSEAAAKARQNIGGASYLGGGAGEKYNPFKNYSFNDLIDPNTGYVRNDLQSAWDEQWMDNLLQTGFRHNHELAVNGGSNKTKYMISLGYLNEEGTLITTGYQRYNGRSNVDSQVTDWFSANLGVSLAHSMQNFSDYDGSSTSNPWYSAQFVSPLFPVYERDLDGSFLLDETGNKQLDYGEAGRPGSYNDFNPVGGLTLDKSDIKNDAASIRTGIVLGGDSEKMLWAKGLKFSTNFSADYVNQSYSGYMNNKHGNQANANGLLNKSVGRTQSFTFNQLLTYNRTFGKHNVDVLAGHEFYAKQYNYLDATKTNIVDGMFELNAGATISDVSGYSYKYRVESWLGRINYNFDNKYYFSTSFRRDASSRFHKDNRWGTFWSVGGNWRVKQEAFLADVEWLDNLSVKASYGEQGNDNIGSYFAWQSLYSLSYANGNNLGALISTLENKNISWEKNGNFNIGADATFLNNRLGVNFEYFNKNTKDMLLHYPMALSTGFSGYDANVGDMRNRGVEFEVRGALVQTNDFTWNMSFMGSIVRNKVTTLTEQSKEIVSGVRIIKEGMPLYTFYMAKSAGVDPQNGAQLYWAYEKDDEGNRIEGTDYITSDYSVAASHKYFLGNRTPDIYGSISTDASWKGLSLSVLTTYSIGGKIYDSMYAGSMENMYYNTNWNRHALRRWQKPGDVTDVPRIEVAGKSTITDRYLIDASYFAIKNITLAYQLPRLWTSKAGLNSVRVFGSVDNLALFTHLQGMDPQYSFTGSTDYVYTPNRTWSVGLEVSF